MTEREPPNETPEPPPFEPQLDLIGDMLDEVGQSSLVVGGHEGACGPSVCVGAHAYHVTDWMPCNLCCWTAGPCSSAGFG